MTNTILDPKLLADTSSRAARYLGALSERPVAPDPKAIERLRQSDLSRLPEESSPAAEVLAELDEFGSPATMATAGPRFFGFVHGGALPATLAANWLATAWDQNAFSYASSPVGVILEEMALAWLTDLFGLPSGTAGAFTTGATLANLTALAAARHRLLARAGWDVEADGLFGAPPIDVYVSAESHPTVRKGLALLGLGKSRVIELETDLTGRVDAARLPPFSDTALICVQAGNVNGGSFDPFPELANAARESEAWIHVDGAFGLWAKASRELRSLAEGVEAADSWATDGHKWLNVPYDCGIAFVRDAEALRAAMSFSAAYLPADAPREPFHYTPETSRRARGIEVWAALRSLGRNGLSDLIDASCGHARRFASALEAEGFEILNEVGLNQVVVSFGTDQENEDVMAAIVAEGTCWCGPTFWHGRRAMRISVSNWATGDDDVEQSIAAMMTCARSVIG